MDSEIPKDNPSGQMIVMKFADAIEKMIENQDALQQTVDELGENLSDQSEILDAIGPLFMEIIQLMDQQNEMFSECMQGDGSNNDNRRMMRQDNPLDKIHEGIMTLMNRRSQKRPGRGHQKR